MQRRAGAVITHPFDASLTGEMRPHIKSLWVQLLQHRFVDGKMKGNTEALLKNIDMRGTELHACNMIETQQMSHGL
ncbi:hypothetical protein K7X08_000569 [Anisodus acutangulus]|uniref:Uncharacterized protein n=1 Tax=Anisodus acutangulus TaxID=402998 RepID=A0A9Q1RD59_9SOLA|nr:hypothetical protein K7X08_000569 [Anisodus acutangulus]